MQIRLTDYYSKSICGACFDKLDEFSEFYGVFTRTQNLLENYHQFMNPSVAIERFDEENCQSLKWKLADQPEVKIEPKNEEDFSGVWFTTYSEPIKMEELSSEDELDVRGADTDSQDSFNANTESAIEQADPAPTKPGKKKVLRVEDAVNRVNQSAICFICGKIYKNKETLYKHVS
jgi:hypothetical protein